MKTIVSYPSKITCSHCTASTDQTVDRARADGWRIGWRPELPNWCPACFGAEVRRTKFTQTYVDEPLWRVEEDDAR